MILVLILLSIALTFWITQNLIAKFGFRNLSYSIAFSAEEVHEGDSVELIETIISRKPIPMPWVKAELTTDSSLRFAAGQSAVSEDTRFVSSCFCLFPYKQIERHWQVTCTKRGRFTVSHTVLVISDLFGTAEWSCPLPDVTAKLTVLPAVRESDQIRDFRQQFCGEILRRRTVIPDRYAICGIREYADGDPVRDICWAASAHAVQPMVWQYQETAAPEITVLLNLETRDADYERISDRPLFENTVRLCADVLGEATRMRLPVRLVANTKIDGVPAESKMQSADGTLLPLLRMLAAVPDTISCKFTHLLRRCLAEETNTAVVIVTPYVSAALMQLAAADTRISVLSAKPFSGKPPANVRYISLLPERNNNT